MQKRGGSDCATQPRSVRCEALALRELLSRACPSCQMSSGRPLATGDLRGMPGGFDRVELRRVGEQTFRVQPSILATEVTQGLRVVNGGAILHDDDVTAQVTRHAAAARSPFQRMRLGNLAFTHINCLHFSQLSQTLEVLCKL